MHSGRRSHTATQLLDGRVLVAGGESSWDPIATAEIYDPATGQWTETNAMLIPHAHHIATLLPDGSVLVAGGVTTPVVGKGRTRAAELYAEGGN